MKVFSFAPLPVGVLSWNDPEPCVTAIVKWTLVSGPSGFTSAPQQEPLCHRIPSLFDHPAELHHPSDFVPRKARCDVLLTGSVYSATPLTAAFARIRVGAFEKRFFALAAEETTAIPLSQLYLRKQPQADAEPVTVGALSREHPERLRFSKVGLDGAAALRKLSIPRTFDWSYFNAAPEDQQIDAIFPGMPISLEGLSPGGLPCGGPLPETWPQLFAAAADGVTLDEVELRCDTLWIDTDRNVCELTLRGTWRPRSRRGSGGAGASLPAALAVTLRGPSERRRPVTVPDLAHGTVRRAIFPEEVADLAEEASVGAALSEVDEEEDVETRARKPPQVALGRLGAMQLLSARPPEMPAPPRDARTPEPAPAAQAAETEAFLLDGPETLRPFGTSQHPRTLPFAEPRAGQEPAPAAAPAPGWTAAAEAPRGPVPPPAAPPSGRSKTLDLLPDAPARAPLPFAGAGGSPRRMKTIELTPGSADWPTLPFASPSAPAPRPPPPGPEEARAQFQALTTAGPAPPPLSSSATLIVALSHPAPAPVSAPPWVPSPPLVPPAALPPSLPFAAAAPSAAMIAPVPVVGPATPPPPAAPEPSGQPPERRRMGSRALPETGQHAPISPMGLLPLSLDAAIQQELWRGEGALPEILARHGIDEVEWRSHLQRRDEMLRAEAEKSSARARAAPGKAAIGAGTPPDKKKGMGKRPRRPVGKKA